MAIHRARYRGLSLGLACLVLPGCVSGNTYTSPRALPSGEVSVTAAIQTTSERRTVDNTDPISSSRYPTLKTRRTASYAAPSFGQIRAGLGKGFEAGTRHSGSPYGVLSGVDLKWQFYRGAIEAAVDPSISYLIYAKAEFNERLTYDRELTQLFSELPAIVALPLGAHQFVATAAVGGAWFSDGKPSTGAVQNDNGVILRGALGFRVSTTTRFSLFPEVSVLHMPFYRYTSLTGGIGVELSSLP